MKCICKCCMQRVCCEASAANSCYLWQARGKKNANLATLKSFFFGESYIWEPEPAFPVFYHHSLFLYSILLRLAFPQPPLRLFVLTVFLCTLTLTLFCSFFCCFFSPPSLVVSLSLVSSLWGSFGSERRFGARLRQYFTLIKRDGWEHSGSCTGTFFFLLVCHASFCCGGKEFISFTAALHHHQRRQFVVALILIF